LFIALAGAVELAAQQSCDDCHGDPSFATEDSSGQSISLHVTEASLVNSAHAGFGCSDCHGGVSEIPHAEKMPTVECSACHEAADPSVTEAGQTENV